MTDLEESFIQLADEDSLKNSLTMTPECIQKEIEKYKDRCFALEQDGADLKAAKEASEQKIQEFQNEAEHLREKLEKDALLNSELAASYQTKMHLAKEERSQLLQLKQKLEEELKELEKRRDAYNEQEKAQPQVLPSLLERKMVFKGHMTREDTNSLAMTLLIQYPLAGGSALITFENPEVAHRIIQKQKHEVELDECRVRVWAGPVELLLPSSLEIEMKRSSRRVLVSSLPSLDLSEEQLLDKLELFFSKKKNGGGEVEWREFLSDTRHVVLSFMHDGVVEELIKKGHFRIQFGKTKHEVRVTPYVSGAIADVQFRPSICTRTVLLSGIPDVLDEEAMQDALEIHFQKPSQGGGEVDAIGYVPAGKHGLAIFEEDTE
ncbi:PREDICTED: interferon-induced 35 kDa protein [Crocodylus porosus]|uniref:Interferon induced protein 35 n=1 Tax=Crocodylus porosus TaxID=8502 RepID=A0A7M4ENE1_CROPO|nr:PREDICTED: interferon-induced 35 kDa protein [Crocodylus porosus]XP_019406030.1 PREDICTED: interferon-induced 35 kDa protein [Crocodylus porosus]XP_019406031.1 PREDICTED: interferon-induced 35 kDa protein [Crocodylus porosus]